GYGIGDRVDLVGLLIEKQMVIAEMRPADVPMKVLGLEIERKYVGQQSIQRPTDVLRRVRAEVGWCRQRRFAELRRILGLGHRSIPFLNPVFRPILIARPTSRSADPTSDHCMI